MQNLIILRGYPGSGKTTVGKYLEKSCVGQFIDHNAILTYFAKIVGNDDGIYEEINIIEKAMAKKLLSEGKSVIVARGFPSKKRVEEYISLAKNSKAKPIVFTLNAPVSILEDRVQSHERKKDFNPTVTAEAVRSWTQNNPLESLEDEHIIDVTQPINEVVRKIKQHIFS